MLDQAIEAPQISRQQLANVFQLFSRAIERLIRDRFLAVYQETVERVVERLVERGLVALDRGADRQGAIVARAEALVRDLIAETFGLQLLDGLVGRILRGLSDPEGILWAPPTPAVHDRLPPRWVVILGAPRAPREGILYLGNKGYMLRRLRQLEFPVPRGFVLTTELFRARREIEDDRLRKALRPLLREHVSRLEPPRGARFGDPARPLLLSVRGGAPVSMPGMLDSFLNVGINQEIAEGVARRKGRPWAAWDAYRRFLQFWGMSHGVERDRFDELIRTAKQQASVPKKALLPWDRMRSLAFQYRALVQDHGVTFVDDPFEQLVACVEFVLQSWDSETARLYRQELQIAEEWGTGVVVQTMVLGNLHDRSGTGVALTRPAPHQVGGIEIYGDYIIQGQGDDVVSGLVATFPITERQGATQGGQADQSLERDFPEIFARLQGLAESLVVGHGFGHQEIEFTFESDSAKDLYMLQSRDQVLAGTRSVVAFAPMPALERCRVATGIGAGGGALSGRVARNRDEIDRISRDHPEDPIILLRPDTVPEDVPLVLEAQGVLTALGGATSHAAVVAQLLGKTCVVGCRGLDLVDGEATIKLGSHELAPGDLLSINGLDGSVYLGRHPVTRAPVRGRT
jgi:pyruvate,orthophosphate dikinase